jgi:hypothetical protein
MGVTNAELKVIMEEQGKKINQMHECLHGNGNPREGLVLRFDRVERWVCGASKLIWIAVGAAVTALIVMIVNLAVAA